MRDEGKPELLEIREVDGIMNVNVARHVGQYT